MINTTEQINLEKQVMDNLLNQIRKAKQQYDIYSGLCIFIDEREGKSFNRGILRELAETFPSFAAFSNGKPNIEAQFPESCGDIRYCDESGNIKFRFTVSRRPTYDYYDFKIALHGDKTFRLRHFENWNQCYGISRLEYATKLEKLLPCVASKVQIYLLAMEKMSAYMDTFYACSDEMYAVLPESYQKIEQEVRGVRSALVDITKGF